MNNEFQFKNIQSNLKRVLTEELLNQITYLLEGDKPMSELHYSQVKGYIKDYDGIEDHGDYIYKMNKPVVVHQTERETGWYFVDETWSDFVGPYKTKECCKEALTRYAIRLEGGSS